MDLFRFDGSYLDRLRAGDPATNAHFAGYFGELLGIKLRARRLAPERIEDIRQETFVRAYELIRKANGIRSPESLGALVNSICNNVLRETYRADGRFSELEEDHLGYVPDKIIDIEETLISDETTGAVREILGSMRQKDSEILKAALMEDEPREAICKRYGYDRSKLRVKVLRAKLRFRQMMEKKDGKGKPNDSLK